MEQEKRADVDEPVDHKPIIMLLSEYAVGRVALAAVTVIGFLYVYTFINNRSTHEVDLYTPLDAAIPFVPWTILIYLSMYLLFATAAVYVRGLFYLRGLVTLVLVALACCIFFLVMPSHYPRPDPHTIESPFFREMFVGMFKHDPPGNTFPSLHVATTTTAAIMLRKTKARWFFGLWAVLVCLSTLTVKQHFVADVVGGVIVSVLVFLWVKRVL